MFFPIFDTFQQVHHNYSQWSANVELSAVFFVEFFVCSLQPLQPFPRYAYWLDLSVFNSSSFFSSSSLCFSIIPTFSLRNSSCCLWNAISILDWLPVLLQYQIPVYAFCLAPAFLVYAFCLALPHVDYTSPALSC